MVCHKFRKLKRSELIKVRFPQVSKGQVPFISTPSPYTLTILKSNSVILKSAVHSLQNKHLNIPPNDYPD